MGALLVNGLRCHLDTRLPSAAAYCTSPTCGAACRVETLTHAFLDCPAAAPAADWLLDLWVAITGTRPPRDARVLLADDHRIWQPAGPAPLGRLWTLLRAAWLHSVWHCRSWRPELQGSSFAAAAATRVVQSVRSAIRRDWLRATQGVRALSDLPKDYFRGRDPALDMEVFLQSWAHEGVLCSVVDGEFALHLSTSRPVPVP
jgi:hypothetical protein